MSLLRYACPSRTGLPVAASAKTGGRGGIRLTVSAKRVPGWGLVRNEHMADEVPVSNPTGFGGEKDRPNVVEFGPVETGALRIEVRLQDGFSGGLLQLKRAS